MRFDFVTFAFASGSIVIAATSFASGPLAITPTVPAQLVGSYSMNLSSGIMTPATPGPEAVTIVYNCTVGAPDTGIAAPAGSANVVYGDQLIMTAGGTLSSFAITALNASTSGQLDTVDVDITFFDPDTFTTIAGSTPIDAFSFSLDFPTPLNPNQATIVNVVDIESDAIINLPDNVIAIQKFSNVTGGANDLGVLSWLTPTVGQSFPDMYMAFDPYALNEGWYFNPPSGDPPINIGFRVGMVVPEPATFSLLIGGLFLLTRRLRSCT